MVSGAAVGDGDARLMHGFPYAASGHGVGVRDSCDDDATCRREPHAPRVTPKNARPRNLAGPLMVTTLESLPVERGVVGGVTAWMGSPWMSSACELDGPARPVVAAGSRPAAATPGLTDCYREG